MFFDKKGGKYFFEKKRGEEFCWKNKGEGGWVKKGMKTFSNKSIPKRDLVTG